MAGIGAVPPAGGEQLGALAAAGALRLRVRGVLSHAWSLPHAWSLSHACSLLRVLGVCRTLGACCAWCGLVRVETFCAACGVSIGLVERVAACGVQGVEVFCAACCVSKFVESWTFSSTREKNPINGRIWLAKLVESCRMVTEVGFFGKCRKKSQKKR